MDSFAYRNYEDLSESALTLRSKVDRCFLRLKNRDRNINLLVISPAMSLTRPKFFTEPIGHLWLKL